MKITKQKLRRIIKEEKAKLLEEFQGSMMDLDDHNSLTMQIDRIIINFTKMGYTREDVMEALKGILEEI